LPAAARPGNGWLWERGPCGPGTGWLWEPGPCGPGNGWLWGPGPCGPGNGWLWGPGPCGPETGGCSSPGKRVALPLHRHRAVAAGDHDQGLAVEHQRTADGAGAGKPGPALVGEQLDHLDRDLDHVADPDRALEIERLGDVDRARPRQAGAEHRRDQAGGVKPVGDAGLERRLCGEMLRQVDR